MNARRTLESRSPLNVGSVSAVVDPTSARLGQAENALRSRINQVNDDVGIGCCQVDVVAADDPLRPRRPSRRPTG